LLRGILCTEGEALGLKLGVLLGCFEIGAVDGLLLKDTLLDGPAVGSLLGIPERLGWIEGAWLGAVDSIGATLGLALGALDILDCEEGLSLGVPLEDNDADGVGVCDTLG
jgi:hypothetical protein